MSSGQMNAVAAGNVHSHFWVGGELTTNTFPRIQRVLLQQLDHYGEIAVDFSEVRVVDTLGVRALLAIRHEAVRKNKTLYFVSRNEAFLKLLDLMYHAEFNADRTN